MAEPGSLGMEWGHKSATVAFTDLLVVIAIVPLLAALLPALGMSKAFQQSFLRRRVIDSRSHLEARVKIGPCKRRRDSTRADIEFSKETKNEHRIEET